MKKDLFIIPTLSFILFSVLSCSGGVSTKPGGTSAAVINSSANSSWKNTKLSSPITSDTFTATNSRLIGRFDRNTSGQAQFTWPGSAIEFRFEGSNAAINIASQTSVRFAVTVDGNTRDLWAEAGRHTYTLAANLTNGIHTVRLVRVNESTAGVTSFISDPMVDGALLAPPAAPQKRLLVIGDSITAGYGVEGKNESCHYALDTSNQQLTYAALAANTLGADLHVIAWSGIGAWRTYGEKSPIKPSILARYPRSLADDGASVWDPSLYTPAAVLINIGTNDYWDGSATDAYHFAMANFIAKVQSDYKGKPIYLIVSPMLTSKVRELQKQVLTALINDKVKVIDLGEHNSAEGFGCDYHPNSTTHVRLSKLLEQKLKTDLKW